MTNTLFSFLFNDKSRLIQLSFLMMFVELALIRWTGSTIFYLFFFSNFVVLASFLGIGIGFLRSRLSTNLFPLAPFFLASVILLCYLFCYEYQPKMNAETGNLDYSSHYFKNNAYPLFISLPAIFIALTLVMASIADGVARTFQKFRPIEAYRLEVIGSLLGIITFSLLAFLHASLIWWSIIISLLFISLLFKPFKLNNVLLFILQISALIVIVMTFSKEAWTEKHIWSAYYKIELQPFSDNRYVVNVNGLAQQIIESVTQRKEIKPFYFLPYQHAVNKALDNVLIIGSGTGGDVAIALAQGAKHVDAVEIDPTIYQLGKKFNPDKPYFDARVSIHFNDGRAFLEQSTNKYDMIIFALTDSLMLIPGQSSLRLENYLYTLESINRTAQLLKSNGVFTIYNYYRAPWLVNRLASTLTQVFKHPPCLNTYGAKDYWATVLSISPQQSALQCSNVWQMNAKDYAAPSTDDHPFLYFKDNNLSTLYLSGLIFVLFMSLTAIKLISGSFDSIKNYPDLFLMGAAFLLLETKNIVNFALLFGTTWFVNALVFIGILLTVYLAIEVTNRFKSFSAYALFSFLCVSLLLSWLIPNNYLLTLSLPIRFFTASVLAFSPIFIANLIFTTRFNNAINSTEAFGANLIGAMMGGLLEYSSLMIGYRNLFILIIGLYSIAMLLMQYKNKNPFLKVA